MANKSKDKEKTNVMRLLDKAKLEYTAHCYIGTNAVNGEEVAAVMGQEPDRVFKTLVTAAKSGEHYVFVVPVNRELDLKKAAVAVGEKAITMLKAKELLPLTGYIHGGCSPIGMKKAFTTVFHSSAADYDRIFFSAGKIGYQVELNIAGLKNLLDFSLADVIIE
jgi:Cys-tRNA(Pro)/Cys-tRNA(Cys) deacylase